MPDPLDQTGLLCEPFYELKEPLGLGPDLKPIVQPGQLVLAHQVYPARDLRIIDIKEYDPKDETKNRYVITRLDRDSPPKRHFPIKELNLKSEENLYVVRGKFRPGIVLQVISTAFYNVTNPEPYIMVVPCLTFKPKHDASYRARVAAMELPHLFYLPAHHEGCKEPSVLRFEHIQPIASGVRPIFIDKKQSFLSDTAWGILQHQFHKFITGKVLDQEIEEAVNAYRSLVMDAYQLSVGQAGASGGAKTP